MAGAQLCAVGAFVLIYSLREVAALAIPLTSALQAFAVVWWTAQSRSITDRGLVVYGILASVWICSELAVGAMLVWKTGYGLIGLGLFGTLVCLSLSVTYSMFIRVAEQTGRLEEGRRLFPGLIGVCAGLVMLFAYAAIDVVGMPQVPALLFGGIAWIVFVAGVVHVCKTFIAFVSTRHRAWELEEQHVLEHIESVVDGERAQ